MFCIIGYIIYFILYYYFSLVRWKVVPDYRRSVIHVKDFVGLTDIPCQALQRQPLWLTIFKYNQSK